MHIYGTISISVGGGQGCRVRYNLAAQRRFQCSSPDYYYVFLRLASIVGSMAQSWQLPVAALQAMELDFARDCAL